MGIKLKQVTDLDAEYRVVSNLATPAISTDSSNRGYVDGEITVPTTSDKAQNPSATSGDGSTTALTISATPARDTYVKVSVNGTSVEVGDAVKTKDCYFSADGGTTARAIANITSGDTLYWNGVIASYELGVLDEVDFSYLIDGTSAIAIGKRLIIRTTDHLNVSGVVTGSASEVFTSTPAANAGKIVDVSSLVPVGATAILVEANSFTPSVARNFETRFRKPGETEHLSFVATNTAVSLNLRNSITNMLFIPLDSNYHFEQYIFDFASGAAITGYNGGMRFIGYVI